MADNDQMVTWTTWTGPVGAGGSNGSGSWATGGRWSEGGSEVGKPEVSESPSDLAKRGLGRPKRPTVEEATLKSLEELGELSPGFGGLAEVALTLARTLDHGAGLATAAVARELRAIMTTLAKDAEHDDAPDEGEQLLEALRGPV